MFGFRRRRPSEDKQAPSKMTPYGTYALRVHQDARGHLAELRLTAPYWTGFEVFVDDDVSFIVEEALDVVLRCPLGSGSVDAIWSPVGLIVERTDRSLPVEVLTVDGQPLVQ